jgi:hypothetical protein
MSADQATMARSMSRIAVTMPTASRPSCCAFVFVDQAAEDIAAVDLSGGWRFRYALAR